MYVLPLGSCYYTAKTHLKDLKHSFALMLMLETGVLHSGRCPEIKLGTPQMYYVMLEPFSPIPQPR